MIVLPHRSGEVLRIADHAGAKADIAALHGLLIRHIIEPRGELLRRFAEIQEAATRPQNQTQATPEAL